VTNDDTLSISFAIDSDSISLSPIRDYEVKDIEGPAVFIGKASYRSSDLSEMDVDEVRDALKQLSNNNHFKNLVRDCPTNTPLVYDDIDYLTRHLPSSALEKCQCLIKGTPFDKELLLLIAYIERQNSLIGHSDNVLEYYLDQRDEVAEDLQTSDEITVELERSFFSYLLLASALIEELTTETVLNELFREETRLHNISEHVKNMGHKARLDILNDIRILTSGAKSELEDVQKRRNNLVHDAQKRAGLNELDSGRDAARILEKTDRCVDNLLTISGKNIESIIARRGCDEYVDHAQAEAIADTLARWERKREDELAALKECDRATIEELHWDVEQSTVEIFDITSGFEFKGFNNKELYDILQEFIRDASGAFIDRIDADANRSNLDRFDFALMLLLCADHDYDEIARWLRTDEKYVQRKENVIAWRASEFENELVDRIPKPDKPIWPDNIT
jgi:hypothetical protein